MERVNNRIFQGEDGKMYSFSNVAFVDAICAYRESHGMCTKNFVIRMISESLEVDESSVKKWQSGKNGVSDIERVKGIAQVLGINYLDLLRPITFAVQNDFETINEKRGDNMDISTETSADNIVNEIYVKCVEIIYDVVESHHYSKLPINVNADSGYNYYAWKIDQIKRLLNYKALLLSKEQYDKLLTVVNEIEMFVKMEADFICDRWQADNPLLTKLVEYSFEAYTVEQLTWDLFNKNENDDSDDFMETSEEEKELESVMNEIAIDEWLCCSRYIKTTEILANEIVKTIIPYFK